jgi:phosphatidate phosphatase PAH1
MSFQLNPTYFSIASDVIVVQKSDGTYQSTPIHVRFGKFAAVFQPQEREVNSGPVF